MAKSYKVETYSKAREAAERAYEVIPQVNASLARKLPLDKEEAIQKLTSEIWPLVQQEYSAENYTDGMAAELSKSKADDWFKMWYLGDRKYSPRLQAEQVQFDKFQDLVKDGKWYNMPKKELDLKMAELGFDPNSRESRRQFLDVLSQHQVNYDRGQIVQQEVGNAGPVEKLGMALNPTITDEATRQALTGDFDDGRLNRAAATDLVTGALMGGMAASKNLMSSPLRIGLADAGAETLRQAANIQGGYRVDPFAPIGAGVAAATVPVGAQWLGSYLSSGGSMGARPLARGFQRGLRGADDPVAAERNLLKQQLIAARDQSIATQKGAMRGPQGRLAGVSDLEAAGAWEEAANKLKALGLESSSERNGVMLALRDAQRREAEAVDKFDAIRASRKRTINGVSKQRAVEEAANEVDAAARDVKAAEANLKEYAMNNPVINPETTDGLAIENVIGPSPDGVGLEGMPVVIPDKGGIARAMGLYQEPAKFPSIARGNVLTGLELNVNKPAMDRLRSAFPEKYAAEAAMGASKRNYKIGLGLGKTLGLVGTSIEPNLRANPFQPESYADKVTNFKETKWFQDLPEKKKLAIERALKGEK